MYTAFGCRRIGAWQLPLVNEKLRADLRRMSYISFVWQPIEETKYYCSHSSFSSECIVSIQACVYSQLGTLDTVSAKHRHIAHFASQFICLRQRSNPGSYVGRTWVQGCCTAKKNFNLFFSFDALIFFDLYYGGVDRRTEPGSTYNTCCTKIYKSNPAAGRLSGLVL